MNASFLTLCVAMSAAAVLGGETANTNSVIGALLPPEEAEGASLREGMELAAEEANQDHPDAVRLVIRGRVGQWGADAVETARMVLDDGVQILIAPPDGAASHLALQVSGRTAIPVIALCPDSSVTRTGVRWMVRIVPQTREEAQLMFSAVTNSDSGRPISCVAVVPEGRAGREVGHDLQAAAERSNCTLRGSFELKSPDLAPQLIPQAIRLNPEVVLVWLDSKAAANVVKSLRAAGYKGILAGPERLRTAEFFGAAGPAAEGFFSSEIVPDEESKSVSEAFAAAYAKRWGHSPTPTAAMAYDALRLAIRILQTRQPGSAHRAFPLEFTMPGATGPLRFDPDGNRRATFRILAAHEHCFVPR